MFNISETDVGANPRVPESTSTVVRTAGPVINGVPSGKAPTSLWSFPRSSSLGNKRFTDTEVSYCDPHKQQEPLPQKHKG